MKSIYRKRFKIKPLEWEGGKPDEDGDVRWTAYSVFSSSPFEVYQNGEEWHWAYCFDEYYDEGRFPCDSAEDGKAKAEEYYLQRLMPALVEAAKAGRS